ncbi:MAG: HD domain-containing protein, partial [Planctomycetota bacterium]
TTPSKGDVKALCRMAALLHDVGHGPFGHFFDDHYLSRFGITHETLGAHIIETELGDLLSRIRRTPDAELAPMEVLDPTQIAWLICRPKSEEDGEGRPDWLRKLKSLFSGIYTVDNMDFVLRDAYMTGFNTKSYDIWRLIHYSFFSERGLTIHSRGMPTLIHFLETRANLFRTVYFHRAVRAIDTALADLFPATMPHLFPGDPREHLDEYRRLTECSLLVDVERFPTSDDPEVRELGGRWDAILRRQLTWKMAAERTVNFRSAREQGLAIVNQSDAIIEQLVREKLPADLRGLELKIDNARHYHRPSGPRPTAGQNFVRDAADRDMELSDDELFRSLPVSFAIFRVYARTHDHDTAINAALDAVLGGVGDSLTNM